MKLTKRSLKRTSTPLAILLILLGLACPTEARGRHRVVVPPPPTLAELPGGDAVLKALEQAEFRFTPEVKTAYLAWSRANALDRIAKSGQQLPADFLAWVDGNPVVADTVYCGSNAAEKLVLLRSLEIDLGKDEVRQRHTQLALAIANYQAGMVDTTTLSNPEQGISLRERPPLKLEIKRAPQVHVDTHAKDRPLDLNDHIINFLEDNPVTEEVKVTKQVDGKQVESVEQRTRPLYAYEVMTSPERQQAFNEYMKAHGQDVTIDCGDKITRDAPKRGAVKVASAMFLKAYIAKGRLPSGLDPKPTPAELAAYLIRNDNYRFPEGAKQQWPKFPLDAPWPVLKFLATDLMPLREREYIWDRFRETGSLKTYGPYIGKIAHQPSLVQARLLQPSEYAYGTYPILCRDGGVCGVMSQIGRRALIAMGVPAAQAAQPGHACLVSVTGDVSTGFFLSIKQGISTTARTRVSRGPNAWTEMARLKAANYGLQHYLDAELACEIAACLPESVAPDKQICLLKSGLEVDPFYPALATAVQAKLTTPRSQVEFHQWLAERLARVDQPGRAHGAAVSAAKVGLDAQLKTLPVPTDPADRQFVTDSLSGQCDAVWLKYQLADGGLPALQNRMADTLKTSVNGERNPTDCALLAARIRLVGLTIKGAEQQQAWASELLPIVKDKAKYQLHAGRKTKTLTDPAAATIQKLLERAERRMASRANP